MSLRNGTFCLLTLSAGLLFPQQTSAQAGPATAGAILRRPIGEVTQLKPGSLRLKTDNGDELEVALPDIVTALRVPPGAKDLKAAEPITVGDIRLGDRVLIRGRLADDQNTIVASTVIVMTRTDLEKAREAEQSDWRRRGIGGVVKAINVDSQEITIANAAATPGGVTPTVLISLASKAALLRYAPDSVRFSDARSGTFQEIKVGDQVRALGNKSEDGSHFAAEKLVSGTFRSLGATVIEVDAASGTVTVKDLASGKPVMVRTNAESRMHRLSPTVAQTIAQLNGPAATPAQHDRQSSGKAEPPDIQQMIERAPGLKLIELKAGEPVIVLSSEGAKPGEVTAIALLAGVEPILASQPKGSDQMVLAPWNVGGGEGGN